jgi:hypothetical protein
LAWYEISRGAEKVWAKTDWTGAKRKLRINIPDNIFEPELLCQKVNKPIKHKVFSDRAFHPPNTVGTVRPIVLFYHYFTSLFEEK